MAACDPSSFDGFAASPDVLEQLAAKQIHIRQCRWRYGDPAWRKTPFPPHRALAGKFTTIEGHAGQGFDGFSGWHPGDHKGCLCSLVPVLGYGPPPPPAPLQPTPGGLSPVRPNFDPAWGQKGTPEWNALQADNIHDHWDRANASGERIAARMAGREDWHDLADPFVQRANGEMLLDTRDAMQTWMSENKQRWLQLADDDDMRAAFEQHWRYWQQGQIPRGEDTYYFLRGQIGTHRALDLFSDLSDDLMALWRSGRLDGAPHLAQAVAAEFQKNVAGLIDRWSNTSADHDPMAVAVQKLMAEKGVGREGFEQLVATLGPSGDDLMRAADEYLTRYGTTWRAILDEMYDETQERLTRLGIDELHLTRGVKWYDPDEVPRAFADMTPGSFVEMDDIVFRPLSSFTHGDHSTSFAGADGWIIEGVVPREAVFSWYVSGFGASLEEEMVMLAWPGRWKVWRKGRVYD
jgi:hypothetical protein